MSTDLLLSLGHNSSAVAIIDGEVYAGYEEERLTRVKSDSSFPYLAINEIGLKEYDTIYVSHWHPFCDLNGMKNKHWQPDMLPKHQALVTLDQDFTHHDAHMMSAKTFAGEEMPPAHTIVMDGFGNFGECISIYDPSGKLLHRVHGYAGSLGLMYQYATANLGMKMNEDEYKLLGYEIAVNPADVAKLSVVVAEIYHHLVKQFKNPSFFSFMDPLYKVEALVHTQLMWDDFLKPCNRDKAKVAFVVQNVLEKFLIFLLHSYSMENVILVGGCFLNVKANFRVLENISGMLCVMPLSGDQGAPLGLYKRANPDWQMPENLCWGKRHFDQFARPRTEFFAHPEPMGKRLHELLMGDYIVNICWGNMEFGPRALCRTSTIALPTQENVKYINNINGRDTIMPMGPVVEVSSAYALFDDMDRVVKSTNYMIMAMEYHYIKHHFKGAAHELPFREGYTGRPQVVQKHDKYLRKVIGPAIDDFGILLNTSFNIHGVPIIYNSDDLKKCIDYQQVRDIEKCVYNLVLLGTGHDPIGVVS